MLISERSWSASYGQAGINLRLFKLSRDGQDVGLIVSGPTDVPRVVGGGLLPFEEAVSLFVRMGREFEAKYRAERVWTHDVSS